MSSEVGALILNFRKKDHKLCVSCKSSSMSVHLLSLGVGSWKCHHKTLVSSCRHTSRNAITPYIHDDRPRTQAMKHGREKGYFLQKYMSNKTKLCSGCENHPPIDWPTILPIRIDIWEEGSDRAPSSEFSVLYLKSRKSRYTLKFIRKYFRYRYFDDSVKWQIISLKASLETSVILTFVCRRTCRKYT